MKEEFEDKDLGRVCIVRNVRARRVIARRKPDHVQLTVPKGLSMKQILEVFEQLKPKLKELRANPVRVFNPDTVLDTLSFSLKIETRNVRNFYADLKNGLLNIICPDITDFEKPNVQDTLRNTIERFMRNEAKRLFPLKLEGLAKAHDFSYTNLTINKSRTRWGSCSSKRSINLSYFCLLLPEYLIDFVMLHELCHTIEMNHGKDFWRLLNAVTNNRAEELTKELKGYSTRW